MRTWPALEIASPDDLVQAALTDFDVAAIDDNAPDRWRVFFHTPVERDRAATALRSRFRATPIAPIDVPDEDWAARSQAGLKAIRAGGIIVAPPWDIGRADAALHADEAALDSSPPITIVIQPSMGFGTGHHATTRLCLSHLQALELHNHTALDVGTGSGVLAIAASRLGATHVLAIDDDADAIQSARENLDLNPGAEVTLGVVDLRRAVLRPFDVVLANLTGGLLVSAADTLQRLAAAPDGRLVLSGFMTHEEAEVRGTFGPWTVERRSAEDDWVCLTLRR